jgi:hypothetical protein
MMDHVATSTSVVSTLGLAVTSPPGETPAEPAIDCPDVVFAEHGYLVEGEPSPGEALSEDGERAGRDGRMLGELTMSSIAKTSRAPVETVMCGDRRTGSAS